MSSRIRSFVGDKGGSDIQWNADVTNYLAYIELKRGSILDGYHNVMGRLSAAFEEGVREFKKRAG